MPFPTKIPTPAVGRMISGVALAPVTIASDGTYTVASTTVNGAQVADLAALGNFKGGVFNGSMNSENIKAATAGIANYVKLFDDWTCRLQEIRNANGISYLNLLFNGVDYFRASWTVGSYTTAVIALRSDIEDPYDEGSLVVDLSGKPCGLPYYFGLTSGLPF